MIHSIPPPHVQATVTHGVLQSPDLIWWLAYLLVLPLAWCLMPGQMLESAKALWEPVGRWIAALHALLDLGLWGWAPLCVLEAFKAARWDNWPDDNEWPDEQKRRLAYLGFDRPFLT